MIKILFELNKEKYQNYNKALLGHGYYYNSLWLDET